MKEEASKAIQAMPHHLVLEDRRLEGAGHGKGRNRD